MQFVGNHNQGFQGFKVCEGQQESLLGSCFWNSRSGLWPEFYLSNKILGHVDATGLRITLRKWQGCTRHLTVSAKVKESIPLEFAPHFDVALNWNSVCTKHLHQIFSSRVNNPSFCVWVFCLLSFSTFSLTFCVFLTGDNYHCSDALIFFVRNKMIFKMLWFFNVLKY